MMQREVSELERLPALPGETLAGRYRIERILGAGGMGVVLCARDLVTRERVAVKMPNPRSSSRDLARFEHESRILESLDSPHFARFRAAGELDGFPYLVMEYFDAGSVAEALARSGVFGLARGVSCLHQTCSALGELHARGIVHRDVKLDNLLLVESAGTVSVKLIDFGIAKRIGSRTTESPDGCVGSPRYMAPEQLVNTLDLDQRVDIWSIGIVAYELFTGQHPFRANTFAELRHAILELGAPPLLGLRPSLPPALGWAVERCLAKDRAERFQNVDEIKSVLATLEDPARSKAA